MMNIYFIFQYLGKTMWYKQILADLNWAEIISQHTLTQLQAYAELSENNNIARYSDCVPNHYIVELKKVML